MRDLDLLHQYLVRLRQERLQQGHAKALGDGALVDIKICAYEAELCDRIDRAARVLANDPGKFIKEFLE